MKVGIIGGGSIGLLLCSYLSENNEVTLYVNREQQKQNIESHGITLVKHGEKDQVIQVKARMMADIKGEDSYIICVKQHHIENLIPYIETLHKPMIFLQNGMGHLKHVKQLQTDTYVGIIEHGASRIDDVHVHHLGEGVIKIASIHENELKLRELTEKLSLANFPILPAADYDALLKSKLIINAVINPLTAIFDISNGSIITNEHIEHLARNLCKEAAKSLQLDETSSWERVVETATITRQNTSSMRADILNRRKTEIEAISGYILELEGDLPYTTFAYRSVLALEKEGTYSDEYTSRI